VLRDPYKERKRLAANRKSLSTHVMLHLPVSRVFGAVAELERSLIVERVKAGLRNAKAKGKRLGRPQMVLDIARINDLREKGLSWPLIAEQLGVGVGTVYRAHQGLSKIREKVFGKPRT
jgi:DNA invertase Pin-like site-specific DNA recombinase